MMHEQCSIRVINRRISQLLDNQYLSLTPLGGAGAYCSFSRRAAVTKFFLMRLSTVIRSVGRRPAWTLSSSKTALKEQGSLQARSARILRLRLRLELLRELMKRLQGRFRSRVAAEMLMIQLRRRVRGLSLRPMQALVSPFSTLGMHSLMQFLALPQKPLAKRRYFCLLKPAIFNIQYQMEEQEPYEIPISPILAEIDKQNWTDLASINASFPKNEFFEVLPPPEYTIYYKYFRLVLEREQVSYRSYLLTTLILKLKSSNYYALMVRSQWVMEQPYNEADLTRELFFINCLLNTNGKEYQLWTYKKRLIQHFKANLTNVQAIYSGQDDFLEYLLEEDSKNYHVWDYKLWLTVEFGKEEQQIARSSTLLFEDYISPQLLQQLREQNLSISKIQWANCYPLWSYRHNLIIIHHKKSAQEDIQNQERAELDKIINWICKKENYFNECGWNYLTGIVLEYSGSSQETIGRVAYLALQIFRQNRKNRFAGGAFLILSKELALRYHQICSQKLEVLNSLLLEDKPREAYYKYLLEQ